MQEMKWINISFIKSKGRRNEVKQFTLYPTRSTSGRLELGRLRRLSVYNNREIPGCAAWVESGLSPVVLGGGMGLIEEEFTVYNNYYLLTCVGNNKIMGQGWPFYSHVSALDVSKITALCCSSKKRPQEMKVNKAFSNAACEQDLLTALSLHHHT